MFARLGSDVLNSRLPRLGHVYPRAGHSQNVYFAYKPTGVHHQCFFFVHLQSFLQYAEEKESDEQRLVLFYRETNVGYVKTLLVYFTCTLEYTVLEATSETVSLAAGL